MTNLWKSLRLAFALTLAVLLASLIGVVPAAARPADVERADVRVIVMQAPSASADMVTYTIKALNHGDSVANHANLTVPFDASALKLVDAQFSGAPAWVVKYEGGTFQIRTERLSSNGGATTATLRFTQLKPNAQLTDRVSYTWLDALGNGKGRSNTPLALAMQPYVPLTHREASNQHFFSANMFLPNEPVTFWYHLPNGNIVPTEVKNGMIIDANWTKERDKGTDYALTDENGAINLRFSTRRLGAGDYTMVARGNISGFTAVGYCAIH